MRTSLRSLFAVSAATLSAPFVAFSAAAQEEEVSASELNAQQLSAFLAEVDPAYEGEGDIVDDSDLDEIDTDESEAFEEPELVVPEPEDGTG